MASAPIKDGLCYSEVMIIIYSINLEKTWVDLRPPSKVQPADQDLPKPQEVVLSMDYVDNMNTPLTCKQIALETSHDSLLSCEGTRCYLDGLPNVMTIT